MKTTTTISILKATIGNPLTRKLLKGLSKYCEKDGKNRIEVAVELYTGQRENACFSCRAAEKIIAKVLKKGGDAFGLSEAQIKEKFKDSYWAKGLASTIRGIAQFGVTRPFTSGAPFQVVWDVTYACNLKCKHCYATAGKIWKDELTTKEAKYAIDVFDKTGVTILAFSGGEPLVRPDIFELTKYAADKGMYVAVATNGTLITKEKAREMKKAGIQFVQISLDGADAKTHDAFRGINGAFDKTVKGIKNSVAENFFVEISTTVTKYNYKEIPDIIKFGEELGANWLMAYNFIPTGRGRDIFEVDLSPEEREEVLKLLWNELKSGRKISVLSTAPQFARVSLQEEEGEKEIIIQPSGVIAIVETKREDVHDGILQALQYVTYLEHIGVPRGCFSTNYRQVIGVIFEDTIRRIQDESFGKTISDETISSAANFIADLITGTITAPPIELKDETIIRILNASVNQLSAFTGVVPKRKLEQLSGMFFAKTLDPSIMENESSKKEFEDAMAKAAAYLIVNQILFYHLLSSATGEFKPLKSVNDPEELQELFNKVLSKDFEPVFGSKIVGFLPKNATSVLNQIINAVKSLKLEQVRRDVIGKVFHGIIPETIRKRIAAYYTKNTAAELLANLCIKKAEDIVVDLACGSGTLLVAAYTRKKELYAKKGEIADHKKLLSEIYGIDISLFAGHLSAVHLSLQEPIYYTEDVNILIEDAFNIAPGFKAFTIREVVEDKVIKEGRPVPYPVDVIIMNPPFTSVERLERRYVERTLVPAMKRDKKDKWAKGRGAGLHVYFLLHADGFLRKGGYIGAVLPESMLDYVKTGIKQYLLDNYHIEYIISSDVEYFSEQTDFRDMLLVARKGKEDKPTKFVMLKVELSPSNIKEILRKIKKNYNYEDNEVRIRIVEKGELEKTTLWSSFLRIADILD